MVTHLSLLHSTRTAVSQSSLSMCIPAVDNTRSDITAQIWCMSVGDMSETLSAVMKNIHLHRGLWVERLKRGNGI